MPKNSYLQNRLEGLRAGQEHGGDVYDRPAKVSVATEDHPPTSVSPLLGFRVTEVLLANVGAAAYIGADSTPHSRW